MGITSSDQMTNQAFEIPFVIISNYTKYKSLKAENMLHKNFKLLPWPIGPLHSHTHKYVTYLSSKIFQNNKQNFKHIIINQNITM